MPCRANADAQRIANTTARGRRLAWFGGGAGGLSWLLPLLLMATLQRHYAAALAALLFMGAGVAYLLLCAPWKFPNRPFAIIYLGLLAIVLAAAFSLLWLLAPATFSLHQRLVALAPLATLFIPVLVFGRRAWDDLGPALMRRDDDGCA